MKKQRTVELFRKALFEFIDMPNAEETRREIAVAMRMPMAETALDMVDVDVLARRLWNVDPEVEKLVNSRGDWILKENHQISFNDNVANRAYETAWRIDDGGLRTKWTQIAERALRKW